jgi:twitching motility protein PilT
MNFDELLQFAVKNDASDIHLQAQSPPMLRIAGKIRSVDAPALSPDDMLQFIGKLIPGADPKALEIGRAHV